MSKPFVSMRAVAVSAGVSVMTVSRALRNDRRVRPDTRLRVLQAAQELGYQPNPMVSALMSNLRVGSQRRSLDTLAFLRADSGGEAADGTKLNIGNTIRHFREGGRERAEFLGFRLEEFWLKAPGMTPDRMSEIIRARGIGGVVVGPLETPSKEVGLHWESFAAAAIGYSLLAPSLHRASNHQLHSIRAAVSKLTARGYRRIGLALPRESNVRSDESWEIGLLHYHASIPPEDRVPALLPEVMTPEVVQEWIEKWKPDVIMSGRLSLLQMLRRLEFRVPEEIGYISLGYYPEMGDVAGINQNSRDVGAVAVDLVVEQLYRNEKGIPERAKIVLVRGDWVDGATVRSESQVMG